MGFKIHSCFDHSHFSPERVVANVTTDLHFLIQWTIVLLTVLEGLAVSLKEHCFRSMPLPLASTAFMHLTFPSATSQLSFLLTFRCCSFSRLNRRPSGLTIQFIPNANELLSIVMSVAIVTSVA